MSRKTTTMNKLGSKNYGSEERDCDYSDNQRAAVLPKKGGEHSRKHKPIPIPKLNINSIIHDQPGQRVDPIGGGIANMKSSNRSNGVSNHSTTFDR